MILVLVLVAQLCSVIHGGRGSNKYVIIEKINGTCEIRKVRVTENLTVAGDCVAVCPPTFLNWTELPNEILCNDDPAGFTPEIPVKFTGKCKDGVCVAPDSAATRAGPQYPLCFDYDKIKHRGKEIATECTKSCYVAQAKLETLNLENGTKCAFRTRSFLGLFQWVSQVGTCQNGKCTEKAPEPEACPRKVMEVTKTIIVDEKCSVTCTNGTDIKLENGRMCTLRASRPWWKLGLGAKNLDEIGVCVNGMCVERDRYIVPEHKSTKGCHGSDIYINENLTIATYCQTQCSDGSVENREDSIRCLWQYRSNDRLDIFMLGQCMNGTCEPEENNVVVTQHTFKPK